MTRPPDPGQPPRRPAAPGGRPYGQPPPGGQPGVPGAVPHQAWGPETQPEPGHGPERKGLLGTLLDTDFDELITPKLIKIFYTLILVMATLWALLMLVIGLWLFQYGWLLTVAAFIFVPPGWLGTMILTRLVLEWFIVQFKGVEYLRVMKDRDGTK